MISPRRLCKSADGRIVEADDPAAAFLVACAGGVVDTDDRAAVAEYLSIDAPADPPVEQEHTVTFGKAKEPAEQATDADAPDTGPAPSDPPIAAKRTRKPKG